MKAETMRAYVVSRLNSEQLKQLHRHEIDIQYCEPAGVVADRFNVTLGDIPETVWRPVNERISRLLGGLEQEYRAKHAGCCFPPFTDKASDHCADKPSVELCHTLDKEVVGRECEFPAKTNGTGIRQLLGST